MRTAHGYTHCSYMGGTMRTRVQPWGNSLAVRIPAAFAMEIGLERGCPVELVLEDGRLLITPVKGARYRLSDLLEGVTPDNLHSEEDFGDPVGNETW